MGHAAGIAGVTECRVTIQTKSIKHACRLHQILNDLKDQR